MLPRIGRFNDKVNTLVFIMIIALVSHEISKEMPCGICRYKKTTKLWNDLIPK